MFIKTLESKIRPTAIIRFGLGLVFLYAGLLMWVEPASWLDFVPAWLGKIIERHTLLSIYAVFELFVAALLLFNKWVKLAAFLAFLDFLSIIVFYGVDLVTFRDVGLMLSALALLFLLLEEKSA
ncbi:MAG: hypothetical protein UY23_C0002G0038 [Candidatus Jorgensenbacteria bacterium GW2011_GWA1_48_11]|uniref:DoxX family protein n=1 Tax=Candidatus Jorgensenbacteria bacterium GW2011_GWA1_48_11 TaxID=1618660 RepID=A0A0G1UB01_9BACT|nr:MAG: hypothetical protein UY23_C0002G0038 [Candidatus Jorgensenbacteria bacterium GW2011_GWA1_48_11]KKW12737.1 MAG: hypothetical protein UY51_C0001G0037 [Candidatus Jorgensenbacteria bacterium GW2011_GWB1_49_9]